MIIISIDVGIKNLAYCLFKVSSKSNYQILDWNTIDLCGTSSHKCSANCNNNEPCHSLAKYSLNETYYCKTHAKKVNDYFIPTSELLTFKSKNKKKNLGEIYAFADKFNIPYQKPCTKTALFTIIDKYIESECFNLIHTKKSSDVNLVEIGKNINKMFTELFEKFNIDYALIENQISPIANRMKTIQGMIAQYFIMKDVDNIDFISSINKLKYFVRSRKRTTYSERKKIGIDITNRLIQLNDKFKLWDNDFNKSKKKDDLADAFLQGIWFLLNSNKINLIIPPKI